MARSDASFTPDQSCFNIVCSQNVSLNHIMNILKRREK